MRLEKNKLNIKEQQMYKLKAKTAWRQLSDEKKPVNITIIKANTKTVACKLLGVGVTGGNVIAKLSHRKNANIERRVYDEFLPKLPLHSLHFYGMVESENNDYCWIFIEDAGKDAYSKLSKEHCIASGKWLGIMHTSLSEVCASTQLPERGEEYYLHLLTSTRRQIQNGLANPKLTPNNVNLLKKIISQFNLLEGDWSQIEQFCDKMPRTLVHGDFQEKNIRIQTRPSGISILPFDWETAGWGVPAVDLRPAHPDLTAYLLTVKKHWSFLDTRTIKRLANVGKIFWVIACISWNSHDLKHEWLEKCMSLMDIYSETLDEVTKEGSLWGTRPHN